jgi:hypothetical protein
MHESREACTHLKKRKRKEGGLAQVREGHIWDLEGQARITKGCT